MSLFNRTFVAPLIIAGGAMLPLATADADTVAYWRFEEGNFLTDSSGNGHHLASGAATSYVLPASGPGASFLDPIPQTGDSNGLAMQRSASDSSYLAAAYHADFASNAFTIEAMVNVTSRTASGFLAGRWNGTNSTYAIQLGAAGEVNLILRNAANSTVTVASGFALDLNTDYYLAVAVDLTAATAAERSATFYLQNLTANGPLSPPATKTGIEVSAVRDPSSTGFAIGAQFTGGNGAAWAGVVDEVRYSSVALSRDALLAVPEPGSVALLGFGSLLLWKRRRD